MLILIEGLVVCFILLMVCVLVLKDGPEKCAVFHEEDVKKRVVELGYITKAWLIPGTEDLMPYIPVKVKVKKWVGNLIMFPLLSALIAWIVAFFM